MPRRRPQPRRSRPLSRALSERRVEAGPFGEDYEVRQVSASRAVKTYRCPGCDHEIQVGTAHLVAWPAGEASAVEDRRHWHTSCWANRATRGPTRRWS